MEEEVLAIIEKIIAEKRESKKHPLIALDIELEKAIRKEVLNILRDLFKKKKIIFGRTVSHNFTELFDKDNIRRTTALHPIR